MFDILTINDLINYLSEMERKYGDELVLTNSTGLIQNIDDLIQINNEVGTISIKDNEN
ncbi:hypothetical protein K5V21_09165 [Clostridium sardiniense]|uniref:Uncharacterized protein n=1 Tax=Clostridium sardiniense TaxID=29369 RepID=A0ABS7KXZ9_CLOSR|nr:hypothetical protein [Clostridium sardiniense]MBY0755629.1 hypothetical protein [Clostridium sardiniense]MDQ0461799.1 hypothetical protein [Clostridium sardiniense]